METHHGTEEVNGKTNVTSFFPSILYSNSQQNKWEQQTKHNKRK
ncbi:hypothetical protein E2C01_040702 [Portunus trituberculatus]|uniref:Uncharacterized protein n=1 Tax=Portunus trituberculatus TaxID=210409 RepID=A0A5B7FI38_PORTR|nr:hypothetical protein [Portunus trituberculatus]